MEISPACNKCKAQAILFASDPYLGYETDTETEIVEKRPRGKYCLTCLRSFIREHPTMSEIQKNESLSSLSFVTQMLSNCSMKEDDESSSSSSGIIIINDDDTSSSSCSCDKCRNCHTETSSSSDTQDEGDIIMIDSPPHTD